MTAKTEMIMVNSWSDRCNNKVCYNKNSNKKTKKELYDIASKELRENDNAREDCLSQLKNWIQQNQDIENCITDDGFLLRFLRVKKFSIPMAQQALLKYLNYRKRFKYFIKNLDCTESAISEIISDGFMFVSPFRDTCGRRVIIYDISKFNLQKFNGLDLAKVFVLTFETLLDDEENQILGVKHVANLSGGSLNFVPLFNVTELITMVRWGEQSVPMRHKEIHLINMPSVVKFVYDFFHSIASEKLRKRLIIHSSFDQLHNVFNRRCLPCEFGGEMPAKEMIKLWKEEMETKRKRLLSLNDMNLLNDSGIITRKSRQPSTEGETGISSLPGSFRKLQFD